MALRIQTSYMIGIVMQQFSLIYLLSIFHQQLIMDPNQNCYSYCYFKQLFKSSIYDHYFLRTTIRHLIQILSQEYNQIDYNRSYIISSSGLVLQLLLLPISPQFQFLTISISINYQYRLIINIFSKNKMLEEKYEEQFLNTDRSMTSCRNALDQQIHIQFEENQTLVQIIPQKSQNGPKNQNLPQLTKAVKTGHSNNRTKGNRKNSRRILCVIIINAILAVLYLHTGTDNENELSKEQLSGIEAMIEKEQQQNSQLAAIRSKNGQSSPQFKENKKEVPKNGRYFISILKIKSEENPFEAPFWKLKNQPTFDNYINTIQDFYVSQYFQSDPQPKPFNKINPKRQKKVKYQTIEQVDLSGIPSQSYEWIQWKQSTLFEIKKNLGHLSKISRRGIVLSWKIKSNFLSQWVTPLSEENLYQLFEHNSLFYDEMASLNLRSPSRQFVMIFKKSEIPKKPLSFSGVKTHNYVAIQTVFRMEENLAYLREWIGYHLHLGVDKFILYHNYESTGNTKTATSTQTKYGINLTCFGFTNDTMKIEFENIWRDYNDYVIYIPWQPRQAQTGEIYYGQGQSFVHYKYYFEELAEFTAFIDIDEFIFSPLNLNLENFLMEKKKENFNLIRITMVKFSNRFCHSHQLATGIDTFMPAQTQSWGPKLIIYLKAMIPGKKVHNHNIKFGKQYNCTQKELRFNHYNNLIEGVQFGRKWKWVEDNVHLQTDASMNRYQEVIANQICELGKCSQNYELACPTINQLQCLEKGIPY